MIHQHRPATPAATLHATAGRAHARRGSAYLLVLVTVTIVTATALSALLVQRVRVRRAELTTDATAARRLAASAIELGLQHITDTPTWRSTLGSGPWLSNRPLGAGTVTLTVVGADGMALPNGSTQPVTLIAAAKVGNAIQMVELTVQDTPLPPVAMEVLSYPLAAQGNVLMANKKDLTVTSGPLSTNSRITLTGSSTVIGDVEAMSRAGTGTITGTATIPSTIKDFPDAGVISSYQAQATALGTTGLQDALLSPATNTLGAANANGMYLIQSGGADVTIQNIRLLGTLIVDTGGRGTVTINNSVLMEAISPDQPVLMVIGDLVLKYDSIASNRRLDEDSVGMNFNPTGTPYLGQTDTDQTDTYPNTIRGLVHVTGEVVIQSKAEVTGVLITNKAAWIDQNSTLILDRAIASAPPTGYAASQGSTTTIVAGSWKKRVN